LFLAQGVRAESYTVRVQETAFVEIAGATAAYTTNPEIADVAIAAAGRISVTGHSSGTTQLVVITASGTQTFLITVAASLRPSAAPEAGAPQARYEGRYSSGIARVQNAVDVITHDGEQRSELHVLHIHDLRSVAGVPSDVIASIFYRTSTPGRTWTLLDEMVDVSQTTVSNTQVRGLHLQAGPLELHGGFASSTVYDGLFLPTDRRWIAGGGYAIDRGGIRWTPSVYGFFSEHAGTSARRGVVAALSAEHRDGDALLVRGDIGVSRSIAINGEVRYASPRSQLHASLSRKANDFPTLGLSDVPGTHADLEWSRRATDRLSVNSTGSFDQFNFAGLHETFGAATTGMRYSLTRRLSVTGGADISEIRTPLTSIRTIGLPVSASYEATRFGMAASYRLLDNSSASRRGDSLRLSGHAGSGRLTASVWAERQRQAPTLDLIFSSEPGLELALLRLGIAAHSPEDVARALRDNAALIDLGFITGVNVNLTPRRVQAGVNLAWLGSGAHSDHLRLLAVYAQDQGISTRNESVIATLSYSRRVLQATDLFGSYSWWRAGLAARPESGAAVEIGLRQQINGVPNFLQRGGTIEGFAFLDPEMGGRRGQRTEPLPDLAVTLDGARTERTSASGGYAFEHVAPGIHQIVAQLPSSARAFFTTPSHTSTKAPAHIDFGLMWAAARIDGRVISDSGAGIGGSVLSATPSHGAPIGGTSDGEGRVVFAVPPGTFRIALAAESLPAGYAIVGERSKSVVVQAGQPQAVSFNVIAIRSVSGRAVGASEVRVPSLGKSSRVDAEGNFVLRSMPMGTFTITARTGGRIVSAVVALPAEPVMMRDVVLGATPALTAIFVSDHALWGPPPAQQSLAGAHVVQAGAFRQNRYAAELIDRLNRSGEQPFTVVRRGLTLVCIGPFGARQDAVAASERLHRAGFEGVVTHR
jgi:hypothetical protein